MLDIGFSEFLLIAVVALVFVGPKDLPVVVRHIVKFMRELRDVYSGLKHQMHQVIEEVGLDDLKQGMTTIVDLDGKPQQAYNVKDLDNLRAPTIIEPTVLPPVTQDPK